MIAQDWLEALDRNLCDVSADVRTLILQDARDAIAEIWVDDINTVLGAPQEYAATAVSAFTAEPDPQAPQGTLGPATIEFRGASSARVRSRVWDPANPRLITTHLFGIGWGINLSAVAVKLGLLRPDDYDDDTLHAIPTTVSTISRALPVAVGSVAAARALRHIGSGEPSQRFGHAANVALALGPTIWSLRAIPRTDDALVRTALASGAPVIALGSGDRQAKRGWISGGVTALAGIVLFLQLLLPVRAGLAALWARKERTT